MKHYKNLSELHRDNGFPPPEHPLISIYQCNQTCSIGDRAFTSDFYMIGFKKLKSGVIKYGRTRYDHDCGSMMFVKPRQVIEMTGLEMEENGFLIFVHEDFLAGHILHSEIKEYHYFDYETNEALHLSPKEEQAIWALYDALSTEYQNNQDEFSRELMLTNIGAMLKYAQRFYKRQFINRTSLSGKTVSKFNEALGAYFSKGLLQTKGLPSVNLMAGQLNLSARYLSDLLKQETGKTAIELIHIFLISEAKNLLIGADQSVAEIAYHLGFENMSYFSRLFKQEVGLSPMQFKKQRLN
ncbi:helix-turn-helix domain-containing protein [Mucilaginibacter paludis]|uniref:Transcriptional regulator, AraC family n=1 Tax=Mucilaginibacter paludis DSM 18603 TaxID=714943 RepID=H1YC25_9SPHI|nr:AraC family transcriptional regulator [Mucilaginibacter paludis]EHQ29588.1 transcriptional regulator, AraC family [Mucilaginibacter paludis DSM 18603]